MLDAFWGQMYLWKTKFITSCSIFINTNRLNNTAMGRRKQLRAKTNTQNRNSSIGDVMSIIQ